MFRPAVSVWLPSATLLLIQSVGCGGKEPATESVVRDSVGIEIVESGIPQWPAGDGWRLSAGPILSLGEAESSEEHELYDVVSALRVDGGQIAVACRGTSDLRFFDSAGNHLRTVGREGGGPGEFRNIFYMWRMGADSLAVFEFGNARVTVLDNQGRFGRAVTLDQVPGRALPIPVGVFADGSFLGRAHMLGNEQSVSEGIHRGVVLFVRWSRDGGLLDPRVPRPDGERYHGTVSGRSIMRSPPFARQFAALAAAESWYYGSMDRFEIEEYSPEGDLKRIIRRLGENRPVTPQLAQQFRDWTREQYGRLPAPVLQWIMSMPMPQATPGHGQDIMTDADGNLWVSEFRLPTEQASWAVFDRAGRFLGVVDTPANGFVTDIGSDYLIGVWQDETEVQRVRVYRLLKGG